MRRIVFALAACAALAAPASAGELTSTAQTVITALDEICSKSPAAAADDGFIARMEEEHGLAFEGGSFKASGPAGTFSVRVTPDGCAIAAVGGDDDFHMADRALLKWAERKGMRLIQPDNVGPVALLRKRGEPRTGKMTWSLLVWVDGSRPAELDVAYTRPK